MLKVVVLVATLIVGLYCLCGLVWVVSYVVTGAFL